MNTNHSYGDVHVLSQALHKRRQESNSSPFPFFSKAPGSMVLFLLCAYIYYSGSIHME